MQCPTLRLQSTMSKKNSKISSNMTLKCVTVILGLRVIFEQIILRTIQSEICLEMKPFWDTPNSVLYWAALTGECKWKFQTVHMWESVPPDQNGLLLLHSVHNVIGLVPAAVAPDREGESSIFSLWKLHRKRGLKTSCRTRDLVCKLSWIDPW